MPEFADDRLDRAGQYCELCIMSANELLHEIEALPEKEQLWILEKLAGLRKSDTAADQHWARFSANQLAHQYTPADSIYDEE